MREAGVNLVSVGIFSWSLLEPSEGVYEFGWLDRVLDLLHANGIRVDLANATASPPPWFSHKYPESLPVTADGVRHSYGSRQAFAASSADYRRARRGPDRADRRPVQGPPRRRDVARPQRVRLPQPAGLLGRRRRRLPALARTPVRQPRGPQRRVGHRLLVPALLGLGADPAAAHLRDLGQPDPAAGLRAATPPTSCSNATRPRPRSSARTPGTRDHQLHGVQHGPAPAGGLLALVRGDGCGLQRPLPALPRIRGTSRSWRQPRTSPAAWPRASRGC